MKGGGEFDLPPPAKATDLSTHHHRLEYTHHQFYGISDLPPPDRASRTKLVVSLRVEAEKESFKKYVYNIYKKIKIFAYLESVLTLLTRM